MLSEYKATSPSWGSEDNVRKKIPLEQTWAMA